MKMKGSDSIWDVAVPWTSDSCLLQKGVAKAKLQYNSWRPDNVHMYRWCIWFTELSVR